MSILEDYIQAGTVKYARSQNWLVFNIDYSGWPDKLFVSPRGRHVWIEFKTEEGGVAKRQAYRHQQLADHKAEVHVVRSVEHGRELVDSYT